MSSWWNRPLDTLTHEEWESLCDGCALCCRLKEEDEHGHVEFTAVACRLLDLDKCRCRDYKNRHEAVPGCTALTPDNIATLSWLPTSCAYRLLAEGHDLPAWHPLVTGDATSAQRAGFSLRDRAISETESQDTRQSSK